jgi:hypothetical protein
MPLTHDTHGACPCCAAPYRYWPEQPRWKLGIRPGPYGSLNGTTKLYYYYMNKIAGGKD